MIKIVNNTVPAALFKLRYTADQTNAIVSYIDATGTIEGAPAIKDEHLPVFDCSKPTKGTRTIHYLGHLRMMPATQPSSPAPSPRPSTCRKRDGRGDHGGLHPGLELGLKAVAVYRDGSRRRAAHSMGSATAKSTKDSSAAPSVRRTGWDVGTHRGGCCAAARGPSPPARRAVVHHAQVRGGRPRGLPHCGTV